MYSQDETRQSDDGPDSSHSAVPAFEARYWGHQSDVVSRRAELIKSHLQASEHVPDLQVGMVVVVPSSRLAHRGEYIACISNAGKKQHVGEFLLQLWKFVTVISIALA
jgi:hypothetical protein